MNRTLAHAYKKHYNTDKDKRKFSEHKNCVKEIGRGGAPKNFDCDPHLARANSPKYSVIANISDCHPKVNFGTLARKSNTGRELVSLLHGTLNTN